MNSSDRKIPAVEFIKTWKNYDRVNPVAWVLMVSAVFIFLGFVSGIFRIFIWLGGLVFFVFVAFFVLVLCREM